MCKILRDCLKISGQSSFLALRKIAGNTTIKGGLAGVRSTFLALRKIAGNTTIKGGLTGVRSAQRYGKTRSAGINAL